ncbi:hypothetical protein [Streptomyces sp. NPDC007355]|uniref:hypothetical protein n=1 Tax=Streptomyces sp. NPDC007355 TaxID=3364778 RepID=UPI00368AC53F
MIQTLYFCRGCEGAITEEADAAVFLWHEARNSGPGRDVYARREHIHQVREDETVIRLLARILVRRLTSPDTEWRRNL